MAVESAGPYASHLNLAPDRQPHQHLITQDVLRITGLPLNKEPANSTMAADSKTSIKLDGWQLSRRIATRAACYAVHGPFSTTFLLRFFPLNILGLGKNV